MTQPDIDQADVQAALENFANPAMSGPVVVKLAGSGVLLEPEAFSDALSMQRDGDSLSPRLDDEGLHQAGAYEGVSVSEENRARSGGSRRRRRCRTRDRSP